ncbi:type II secretion system F family protein [Candidatus Woesearchaeota archaeon]|nr:type II secretion system F family protein [Candidatus Woesearchaeota archaeon]
MDFLNFWMSLFPELDKKLKMAVIADSPKEFTKKSLKNALILSLGFSAMFFFLADKMGWSLAAVPLIFISFFLGIFFLGMKKPDAIIKKRGEEIDRDVLFAGRFLLIKLNSGKPLMNTLVEASQSYGVANKYFKEIVRQIELGTPMEKALDHASYYSPSEKFRKLLFQISNALKIGIDVTHNLQATLDEVVTEQMLEIKKYGKRLNSFTMFYMLMAIIIPSLGVTLFAILATITGIPIHNSFFFGMVFFIILIQLLFMSFFRSIRPHINI